MNYIDHNKMEKVKVDKQFSLKVKDFLKGIYVSVIAPLVLIIAGQFQIGNFDLNWKELGLLAISTFVAYLLKNYLTPTKVVVEQPSQTTIEVAKRNPDDPILYPPGTPIHPKKP